MNRWMLIVVVGLLASGVTLSAVALAQDAKPEDAAKAVKEGEVAVEAVKVEATAEGTETPKVEEVDPKIKEAAKVEAKRLLKALGIEENIRSGITRTIEGGRQQFPMVKPEVWDNFLKSIKYDELLGFQADAYADNMSMEDLKAAADFYESPVGKRFLEAQPKIGAQVGPDMEAWYQGNMMRLRGEITKAMMPPEPAPLPPAPPAKETPEGDTPPKSGDADAPKPGGAAPDPASAPEPKKNTDGSHDGHNHQMP